MAFKEIKINPDGEAISFDLDFSKTMPLVTYSYNLWETKVNGKYYPESKEGTNRNLLDDSYTLPMPLKDNVSRMIKIIITVEKVEEDDKDFEITMIVKQGNKTLGSITEKGKLKGNHADVYLTAHLI